MEKVRAHNQVVIVSAVLGLMLGGCSTGQDSPPVEAGKQFDLQGMPKNQQPISKEGDGAAVPPVAIDHETVSAANVVGTERIPEQHLRIWIAPYQDVLGNLHEESYIQTVIKAGQWKFPIPTPDEYKVAY